MEINEKEAGVGQFFKKLASFRIKILDLINYRPPSRPGDVETIAGHAIDVAQ